MSFFPRERPSKDTSPRHTYDYNQHYNNALDGLNNFTFGGNSGFTESPYELFRQNVAKHCERFMYSSFDQDEFLSAEEKSLRALKRAGDPGRLAQGDASCVHGVSRSRAEHQENISSFQDDTHSDGDKVGSDCYCSGDVICKHCQLRQSKSHTNIFSVMSVSFEPLEGRETKKPSLIKKITHMMNSDYNSHKEKHAISRTLPMKQVCQPSEWNACECHVHIGKHNNCCQCQEPYHRTNCECVQHNGSHSYCCRCDPLLLQEYDQHLKKKRYLRLLNDDKELSAANSVDSNGGISKFSRSSPRTEEFQSGMKSPLRNRAIPLELSSTGTGDKFNETEGPDANHHPCESCCKKLDNIYGNALREVHNMLMEVSRTLLPSAHCCSLESQNQNVSRLRPACQMESQSLDTVESNVEVTECTKEICGTNEVGVQVTPKDFDSKERSGNNLSTRVKNVKKKCVIS